MRLPFCIFLGLFAIALPLHAAEPLRLMQNLDGDLSFTGETAEESKVKLEKLIDDIANGPVTALMWSIGCGSDILNYPTKVASTWGWRATKYDDDREWKKRVKQCRAAAEAGLDGPRIVGDKCKPRGLAFYPSYRMNDAHYCSDPLNYPLTGKFWMEHQDASIGASPVPGYEGYKYLLNFAREDVRAYRLGVIFEAMDRYADVMDGFELDFNRFQIFFPPGTAAQHAPLMTELLVRAREHLNGIAEKQKRPLKLIARVPPTLKNCAWSGLDIEEWMKRRLLDGIIPAQVMTLAHDMPIDEFVRLAKPAGCEVIGSLYGRSNYNWPFSAQHDIAAYKAEVSRTPTPPQFLGAALNQRFLGASGHQIYNLVFHAHPDIVKALVTQQGLRRYLVTQAYFHDRDDTYEYRKQLPAPLDPGQATTLRLLIGESPSKATAYLRLGLHGANQAYADTALTVRPNGYILHEGPAGKHLVVATGLRHGIAASPATEAYAQWPVSVEHLTHGWNEIAITLTHAAKPLQLVETEIAVVP